MHLCVVLGDRLPDHVAALVDIGLDRCGVDQRVELRIDVPAVVEGPVTRLVIVRPQYRR